ncbi:MAG: NEL-type E3 ubiquitin ligase domain-containing protein [Parachlamydiales bacterium]
MSSFVPYNEPASPSVYQHLLRLHADNPLEMKVESLNALPESFRLQIFSKIWELSGEPSELDYGKIHVFDSLPMLQEAVNKVAANAFQSLNQEQKHQITSTISQYVGSASGLDLTEEVLHATDNIPLLLKCMHESLGDLTPEIQRILDEWVDHAEPGENRGRARSVIIQFLTDTKRGSLEFPMCNLKNLPLIFDQKPFESRLRYLGLSGNKLTFLPEQIGNLHNLTRLGLSYNKLSSLPEQFGQLQNLNFLDLSFNQFTLLPDSIWQLHNLKDFNASGNRISSLSEQIGQLRKLVDLSLSETAFTSIPEQIGLLENLMNLFLYSTQLSSLPEQIGLLGNLSFLNLGNNRNLQSLPNGILNLAHDCQVSIEGSGLSEHVLNNLQEICHAPDYLGPRFYYSMGQSEGHDLKPLPTLINEFLAVLGEEERTFPQLDQLDDLQKGAIQSWLSRLSDAADFQRGGEFQKAFVKQVVGYLQEAENDQRFRELFLNIVTDAADTCGDRISLSILHIGIASRLRQIRDLPQLRQFLIGTVWPMQMLEEIAREKAKTLFFLDEIEVYLGYPIMLRERLGLDIAVQEMLYFRCSGLKQDDLDQAAEFVMLQQSYKDAVCNFLASSEDWIIALRDHYPAHCAEIDQLDKQELESAGDDLDKLFQHQVHKKERWEALTAWALAEEMNVASSSQAPT